MVDGTGSWYKASNCLWSSKTNIQGMATLVDQYEDLELLFVKYLGVKTLTMEIVHDELIRLGSSQTTTVDETVDKIMALNSYMVESDASTYPDPEQMRAAKILPIRYPDDSVKLASAVGDFIIVDRSHLGAIFAKKIQRLDFEFNVTRRLRPFIEWLGLSGKYLSGQIREITQVDEENQQPLETKYRHREINLKAHALYR